MGEAKTGELPDDLRKSLAEYRLLVPPFIASITPPLDPKFKIDVHNVPGTTVKLGMNCRNCQCKFLVFSASDL